MAGDDEVSTTASSGLKNQESSVSENNFCIIIKPKNHLIAASLMKTIMYYGNIKLKPV